MKKRIAYAQSYQRYEGLNFASAFGVVRAVLVVALQGHVAHALYRLRAEAARRNNRPLAHYDFDGAGLVNLTQISCSFAISATKPISIELHRASDFTANLT